MKTKNENKNNVKTTSISNLRYHRKSEEFCLGLNEENVQANRNAKLFLCVCRNLGLVFYLSEAESSIELENFCSNYDEKKEEAKTSRLVWRKYLR